MLRLRTDEFSCTPVLSIFLLGSAPDSCCGCAGEMVDNIEQNVNSASDKVEVANTGLHQARTYQSAARKVCAVSASHSLGTIFVQLPLPVYALGFTISSDCLCL